MASDSHVKVNNRWHRGSTYRSLATSVVLILVSAGCQTARIESRHTTKRISVERSPVTIVEYSDFQCPYAAAGQPIIERVLAVFGDAVRYEYRHYPLTFHPWASIAASYFEAIRDRDPATADHFRGLLFRNRTILNSDGEAYLREAVTTLGFDPDEIARESRSPSIQERVTEYVRQARALELEGTPGYVVAGLTLRGPTPFDTFERIICDDLLGTRSTALVSGDDRADCWDLVQPNWARLQELDELE